MTENTIENERYSGDIAETTEWVESLEDVLHREGPDRGGSRGKPELECRDHATGAQSGNTGGARLGRPESERDSVGRAGAADVAVHNRTPERARFYALWRKHPNRDGS